ncbi:MAG TPA: hypothetical protein VFU63_02250, partial [Ktedonobacterales bacterium]|nr:hypothetical protein [Ktedonobacterales bacterium]
QLLAVYQGQLKEAQNEAENTAKAAAQYMRQHNLDAASAMADPQYQLLNMEAQQASTTLTNIQADINTINKQLATLSTGTGGLYQAIDPPTVPTKPESRAKTFLLGGAIGLGIGLLAGIGYLLILVRLDESIYSVADLPESSGYPVLIQIPQLPRRSAPWITHNDETLLPDKEA